MFGSSRKNSIALISIAVVLMMLVPQFGALIGNVQIEGGVVTSSSDDHTITYHPNGATGEDVTVTYSGIASTEYNPLYWKDSSSSLTSNWVAAKEEYTGSGSSGFDMTVSVTATGYGKYELTLNVLDVKVNSVSSASGCTVTLDGNTLVVTPNSGWGTRTCTFTANIASTEYSKVFAGWSTTSNPDNGKVYLPGDLVPSTVKDLYAVWAMPNLYQNKLSYSTTTTADINLLTDVISITAMPTTAATPAVASSDAGSVSSMYLTQYLLTSSCTSEAQSIVSGTYRANSGVELTYTTSLTLKGDTIFDSIKIKSSSVGGSHGRDINAIRANGHILIMGTGIGTSATDIKYTPAIVGGGASAITTAIFTDKEIVSQEKSLGTANIGTCVIVHSGHYYNVVAGGCSYAIGTSGNPLSTYLVMKGGYVYDTLSGGGNAVNNVIYGNTYLYAVGVTTTGDTWQEMYLGYNRPLSNSTTITESSIVQGGSFEGDGKATTIKGGTHLLISDDSCIFDAQAGPRQPVSTVGGIAYLEITGKAVIKHVACGAITDGNKSAERKSVAGTDVRVSGNPKIAYLLGAGYDTWNVATYSSITSGTLNVEVNGGTIGYVYGAGFRGTVGSTNGTDTVTVNVTINGGTILNDVFGGGRGGVNKICHNLNGTPGSYDSTGTKDSTGMSYVYGNVTVKINGGVIKGSVYGGGESQPTISTDTGLSLSYTDTKRTGVAQVFGSTKVIVSGGTVEGSVYGGGKGISLDAFDSSGKSTIYSTALNCVAKDGTFKALPWCMTSSGNADVATYVITSGTYDTYAQVRDGSTVEMTGGIVKGSVYGGGGYGLVNSDVTVSIEGGEIDTNVFAGGLGALGKVSVKGDRTITFVDGNVKGSVYGGSSLGNDQADSGDSDVVMNIMSGYIGGSVYGGGFKGTTNGSSEIYIGCNKDGTAYTGNSDTLTIKQSIYGGGDVGELDPGEEPFTKTILTGNTTISVINNGIKLSFTGSIFGSGNSCLIGGTSTVTINGYTIKEMESMHRIDNLTIIASELKLNGREASNGSNTVYSFYKIKKLMLKSSSFLHMNAGVDCIDEYWSLSSEGNPTKASSPQNKIEICNGVELVFKKIQESIGSNSGTYSVISGYTIVLKPAGEQHYGTFIIASNDSDGGFVTEKNGTYEELSESESDGCICYYEAGSVSESKSAITEKGTTSTMEISIPRTTSGTGVQYAGGYFIPSSDRYVLCDTLPSSGDTKEYFRIIVGNDSTGGALTFNNGAGVIVKSKSDGTTYIDDGYGTERSNMSCIKISVTTTMSNEPAYIGRAVIMFYEVNTTTYMEGDVEKELCLKYNTYEVSIDVYTTGDALVSGKPNVNDSSLVIETAAGSGYADLLIPRGLVGYDVTLESFTTTSSYPLTISSAKNLTNSLGWNGSLNDVVLTSSSTGFPINIGSTQGGYDATIRFSISGFSGADQTYTAVFKITDGNTSVKTFTVTLKVTAPAPLTVLFMDGDTLVGTRNYAYGSTIQTSECPITGDYFVGWFSDSKCTNEYNFNRILLEDTVLYAKYACKVSFDYNIGVEAVGTIDVGLNSTLKEPIGMEREGFQLVGWYSDPNFQNEWVFYGSENPTRVTEDVTLYAKWVGNDVTVKFKYTIASTSGELDYSGTVSIGDEFGTGALGGDFISVATGLMKEIAEEKGYSFVKWKAGTSDIEVYDDVVFSDKIAKQISGGILYLTAIVSEKAITVEFIKNAGDDDQYVTIEAPQSMAVYPVDGYYSFDSNNATRSNGYTLKGWATNPDGTGTFKDPSSGWKLAESSIASGSTYKLYAIWEKIDYTVSVSAPSGGVITVTNLDGTTFTGTTANYGKQLKLSYNAGQSGYVFSKWMIIGEYTISDDSVKSGAVLTIKGNCVIGCELEGMIDTYVYITVNGINQGDDLKFYLMSGGEAKARFTYVEQEGSEGKYTVSSVSGIYTVAVYGSKGGYFDIGNLTVSKDASPSHFSASSVGSSITGSEYFEDAIPEYICGSEMRLVLKHGYTATITASQNGSTLVNKGTSEGEFVYDISVGHIVLSGTATAKDYTVTYKVVGVDGVNFYYESFDASHIMPYSTTAKFGTKVSFPSSVLDKDGKVIIKKGETQSGASELYFIIGWYKDKDHTEQITGDVTVSDNTTVYLYVTEKGKINYTVEAYQKIIGSDEYELFKSYVYSVTEGEKYAEFTISYEGFEFSKSVPENYTTVTAVDSGIVKIYFDRITSEQTISFGGVVLTAGDIPAGWTLSTDGKSMSKEVEYGETVTFPAVVKEGSKTFWNIDGATSETDSYQYVTVESGVLKAVTIYAEFTSSEYKLTITISNGDFGDGREEMEILVKYNAPIKDALASVTINVDEGYKNNGWTKDGVAFDVETEKMPAEDLAIQMNCVPITYYIVFNINDGSATESYEQEFQYGTKQKLTAVAFEREGYNFRGWALESTGAVEYEDEEEVKNLTTVDEKKINLYARWCLVNDWNNIGVAETIVYDGSVIVLGTDYFAEPKAGTASIQFYDSGKTALTETPKSAGSYYFIATVEETDDYTGLESDYIALTISPKEAELQWTAPEDLEYSSSAKIPSAAVSNLCSGDYCTVTVELTDGMDNVNVGAFTFTATALGNGNYSLPSSATSDEYTITPKMLSMTSESSWTKTYDKKAEFTGFTVSGIYSGEVTVTAAFASVNAGTDIAIAFTISDAVALSGKSANYAAPTDITGTILAKKLTVESEASWKKVYDGNNTFTEFEVVGIEEGDTVTVTASFNNINVADADTISFTISGTSVDNYVAPDSHGGTIAKRPLTVSNVSGKTISKVYDGNTDGPSLTLGVDYIFENVVGTDKVDFYNNAAVYNSKDVSSATKITITLPALDNGNYTIASTELDAEPVVELDAEITQLTAEISWTAPGSLVYSNSAKTPTASVSNLIDGDTCTVTAALTEGKDNVNVGIFTFTASELSNGNYCLPNGVVSPEYEITTKALSMTPTSSWTKTYDKSAEFTGFSVSGIYDEEVTVTAAFASVNAGTGITIEFTVNDVVAGKKANYSVPEDIKGTILAKELTIKNVGGNAITKVYDGTVAGPAVLTKGTHYTFEGIISGDDVDFVDTTSVYNSKNVSSATKIIISSLELSNGNYTISSAELDAEITKRTISFDLDLSGMSSRQYDGTTTVTGAKIVIDNAAEGEELEYNVTIAFDSADAGTRIVNATGFALTEAWSGNYNVTSTSASATAESDLITKRIITVSGIGAKDKVYDATTAATIDLTNLKFSWIFESDELSITADLEFANANAGEDKTVTISDIVLTGASIANYELAAEGQQETTKADISPASFTGATFDLGASSSKYDGTAQTVTIASVALSGFTIVSDDYDVIYPNNMTDVGQKTIYLKGKGNFEGTTTAYCSFEIEQLLLTITDEASSWTKTYDKSDAYTGFTVSGIYNNEVYVTAAFASVDAGSNISITFTVSDTVASSGKSANYAVPTDIKGTISAKQLTAASTAHWSKVYDGEASFSGFTISGIIDGDAVTVTASFNSKDVATADVISFTVSGDSKNNYVAPEEVEGTITKKVLTDIDASGITVTKVYDGTVDAGTLTGTISFTGKVGQEAISIAAVAGDYSDAKAGTGKTISLLLSLSGSESVTANYELSKESIEFSNAEIEKRTITVSGIGAIDKVYDATTAATIDLTNLEFSWKYGTDVLSITADLAFENANAGEGKKVVISNIVLTGDSSGNYILAAEGQQGTATATIEKKTITISTVGGKTISKVYDGNTNGPSITLGVDYKFVGVIDGDSVDFDDNASVFDSKDVSSATKITITSLVLDNGNYTIATAELAAEITKREISFELDISGVSSRQYDGTADVTGANVIIKNAAASEEPEYTVTIVFDSANAGTRKVNATGFALTEEWSANYSVASTSASATALSDLITKREISFDVDLTGISPREYDGTTGVTGANIIIKNAVEGEELKYDISFAFDSANAGTRTVNATGFALIEGWDTNYSVTSTSASATAESDLITKRVVTVSGIGAKDKVYDATTTATIDLTNLQFSWKYGSDDLSITATVVFEDANAGTKTVYISDLALDGESKGNYELDGEGQQVETTATISPASFTGAEFTLDKSSSIYIGEAQTVAIASVALSGFTIVSDDYDVVYPDNMTDVGQKSIYLKGKGNFDGTTVAYCSFEIEQAALTITDEASSWTKTYDKSDVYTGFNVDGIYNDEVYVTAAFASIDAGSNISITFTVKDNVAGKSANYAVPTDIKGTILAKQLTAESEAWIKEYDGEASFTGFTISGVIEGDTVTVTASFNSKNVLEADAITFTVSGEDAGNYVAPVQVEGKITAKALTVSLVDGVSITKQYDGTIAALDMAVGVNYKFIGVIDGDTVDFASKSWEYDSKNVLEASKVIAASLELDNGNYTISSAELAASITPREITIENIICESKVYDGTTTAVLNCENATFVGKIEEDILTASAIGEFDSKDVGENVKVTISSLVLGGESKDNYVISESGQSMIVYTDITPLEAVLSWTAPESLVYNKQAKELTATVTNLCSGDECTVTVKLTDGKDNVNVGAFTFTAIELSNGNYKLPEAVESGEYTITPAEVKVSGIVAEGKEYDGTVNVTFNIEGMVLEGKIDGDDLSVIVAGEFDDKHAGIAKNVNLSFELTGESKDNYVASSESQTSATADISKKVITVEGIIASDKMYDGTVTAALDCSSLVFKGIIEGDIIALSCAGEFDDKNVGDRTVVFTSFELTGEDSGNYDLQQSGLPTVTAKITQRSLTFTSGSASKQFDESPLTMNEVNITGDGFVLGEGVTFTVTGSQTDVGESSNTFTYKFNDNTDERNYNVEVIEGTLTVTEAPIKSVIVYFDSNGGSPIEQQTVNIGDTLARPSDPVLNKHAFVGWYLNGEPYDFSKPVEESMTLKAEWIINEIDIGKVQIKESGVIVVELSVKDPTEVRLEFPNIKAEKVVLVEGEDYVIVDNKVRISGEITSKLPAGVVEVVISNVTSCEVVTLNVEHTILEGDGQVIKDGESIKVIRSNGFFGDFDKVYIDGVVVDPSNYDVSEGSIKIKFHDDYIKSLSNGKHNIGISVSTSGVPTVFASLTIEHSSSGGGIDPVIIAAVAIGAIAACGAGAVLFFRYR